MKELVGSVQCYDWGTLGKDSKVAQLAVKHAEIDNSKPYAELWMGTHPNGPSKILNGPYLKDFITPEMVDTKLFDIYKDLPFLLKVLSIRKALSIQAHPDKELARKLHQEFPKIYKDPNHKPEMTVALTPFEAFIGFRPLEEIKAHLEEYPELASIVGSEFKITTDIGQNKKELRRIFSALQNAPQEEIAASLKTLFKRIEKSQTPLSPLLIRLNSQYPDDVGIYCALLLNHVVLKKGQAIFLAANEPHAYLSGDCVECMAASDNVVRSGLTPKFKDVKTLVEMLTYNYGTADSQILNGRVFTKTGYTVEYNPPIQEFSILRTSLGKSQKEVIKGIPGASILVCTGGKGTVKADDDGIVHDTDVGSIYFVAAGVEVEMIGADEDFTVFRALCVLDYAKL